MKLFLNGGGCGKQTILTYKEINKMVLKVLVGS